ncbi:CYTH domain-containing protein [Rhizobium sp. YIM 134829]|uniref:CYTH domain-containing protein n=1 Tax=Rhizobium sp. YIM 134829 TaxID=3390453 RepID=UPI003979A4CC
MAKEIERKFLVAGDGWRATAGPGVAMRQFYIAAMSDRSVRLRILDAKSAKLTIKVGTGLLVRDEFEFDVPLSEAEDMLSAALGTVIEKTRYRVPGGAHVWEVDVYAGVHAGLIVAEVEMRSEDDDPTLPDWLGAEVTSDGRYSNFSLATHAQIPGEA